MEIEMIILILGIFAALFIGLWIGHLIGAWRREMYWRGEIKNHRKDAVKKSRAVLSGQFSEQLAPYFPGFKYSPSECRFIGKPIDFIVFKGMDDKTATRVDEIIFVEVKSGKAKLSEFEKKVKEAVEDKRVRWEEWRVPDSYMK